MNVFLAMSKDLMKDFDLWDLQGLPLPLPLFPFYGFFTGSCLRDEAGSMKPSVSLLVVAAVL